MLFTGGQTGAGKSRLVAMLAEQDPSAVLILIDELRQFHPQIDEIKQNYPNLLEEATMNDAYAWADMAKQIALEQGYSIINEKTLRDPDGIVGSVQDNSSRGCKSDFHVLAVSELESALSVFERYMSMYTEGNTTARLTNMSYHTVTYNDMLATVKELERLRIANSIQIYIRGDESIGQEPIQVYTSSQGSQTFPSAAEAVAFHRAKDARRAIGTFGERYRRIFEFLTLNNLMDETAAEQLRTLMEIYNRTMENIAKPEETEEYVQ